MKNKKILYFLTFLFCFFPILKIDALEVNQKGYINKQGVLFYSEANYKGDKVLDTLDTGDQVTLLDNNLVASTDTNRCSSGFYKVSFYWESYNKKTYTGYVCSNYINFNIDTSSYATEFAAANIPEIYWEKLALLKTSHPKWKFTGYETGLNWNDVISAESLVGKSYIQSNNPIYLSLDGGSYNPDTKTYREMEAGGWYAANKQTVAYYMDPRNFLDGINIFMFENLGYNSTYQTKAVVENIFKNTDLLQYTDNYIEAATYNGNNVSPISLAARSRQEIVIVDGKLSDSANGATFKDKQVYNFYNIGAFTSCDIDGEKVNNPIRCGLKYAYNNNWFDAKTAILEGSKFIANGYINKGQNTLYFQRWNVTKNNTYSHQYMTNISAPISEGKSTYNAYSSIEGLLDSEIEFIIPVYNNMPVEVSKLPVEVDKEQIDKIEEQNKPQESIIDISEIVNGAGYRYRENYIYQINPNTSKQEMVEKFKSISASSEIVIIKNGRVLNDNEVVGTGTTIKITNNNKVEELKVIIYGDTSGDGHITILDLLQVQKNILGSFELSGEFFQSADINHDGKITILDLLMVQKDILNSKKISQS